MGPQQTAEWGFVQACVGEKECALGGNKREGAKKEIREGEHTGK